MLGQIFEGALLTLFAGRRVTDRMLNSSGVAGLEAGALTSGFTPPIHRLLSGARVCHRESARSLCLIKEPQW